MRGLPFFDDIRDALPFGTDSFLQGLLLRKMREGRVMGMTVARHPYQSNRYRPGYWNGLQGSRYYGQYFNIESEERITAMMEISAALRSHGINPVVTRWKKYTRIMISRKDYLKMGERLKTQIETINAKYMHGW